MTVYEVFVGRLPFSVTEDELRKLFSECGCVVRVSIAPSERIQNLESPKYTYGFVGFTDECGVKKAVNCFDGKSLHGRQIRVEESYRTKEWMHPRNAELKLPAWSDLKKKIEGQTFSLSKPFTFPVEHVSLDLTEIDELVRKTSPSTEASTHQQT